LAALQRVLELERGADPLVIAEHGHGALHLRANVRRHVHAVPWERRLANARGYLDGREHQRLGARRIAQRELHLNFRDTLFLRSIEERRERIWAIEIRARELVEVALLEIRVQRVRVVHARVVRTGGEEDGVGEAVDAFVEAKVNAGEIRAGRGNDVDRDLRDLEQPRPPARAAAQLLQRTRGRRERQYL